MLPMSSRMLPADFVELELEEAKAEEAMREDQMSARAM